MRTIDLKKIAEYAKENPDLRTSIPGLQVAVYVMVGGGMLGKSAAEQPADFYIDDRVGRLPYKRKEIKQAVSVLATLASVAGLDPHNMPQMPDFHGCGVF